MGQTSGGFLTWWNQLCPGAPLDQKRLAQMAGDFSRRLHAFAIARATGWQLREGATLTTCSSEDLIEI